MKTQISKMFAIATLPFVFAACSPKPVSPQDEFWDGLQNLCGKSFAGKLVSLDETDAALRDRKMVMHVTSCSDTEIRIPFHIGDNHSRTWVLSRTDTGLRLKHQHNHEDGHEDKVSQYGGDTSGPGTTNRQEFPVDTFSKEMFVREGLDVSVTNVWAVEVSQERYAYELRRENRHFRVEFDLNHAVNSPPDAW
ncbi:MAG: hypothetical protein COA47_02290 [Robiginitomaculum sp.]|nr:MAG: hypothetical protein COA47_02290 [Robiginitomaculum sp.]